MITTGILPLQGKIPMVEPGIEPGTSCLVVRSSDHQTTRFILVAESNGSIRYCFEPNVLRNIEKGFGSQIFWEVKKWLEVKLLKI